MTTPVPPSKAKAWIALVGTLLTAIVPYVLQYSTALPAPWPALIGGMVALLTVLGVYHAPYKPTGTVIVQDPSPAAPPPGGYQNPWK